MAGVDSNPSPFVRNSLLKIRIITACLSFVMADNRVMTSIILDSSPNGGTDSNNIISHKKENVNTNSTIRKDHKMISRQSRSHAAFDQKSTTGGEADFSEADHVFLDGWFVINFRFAFQNKSLSSYKSRTLVDQVQGS